MDFKFTERAAVPAKPITVPPEVLTEPARVNAEISNDIPENTVTDITAHRILDLITTKDLTPTQAATELGMTRAGVGQPALRKRLKELIEESYVAADIQRAALRAGRFKMFMEALDAGITLDEQGNRVLDTGALKIAAEVSKQIGADPEIGLNQPPTQVVNIDLGNLAGLLENLEPLPGFERKEDE